MKSAAVNKNIAKICNDAGGEFFIVHAFREILGHTKIKMAMDLYVHGNNEKKHEYIERLNFGT